MEGRLDAAEIIPTARLALKRAIAWRPLAEIRRHHAALDRRIAETHPCGGQYDCLSLVLLPAFQEVCSFDLPGSVLNLGPPIGSRRADALVGAPDGADGATWR